MEVTEQKAEKKTKTLGKERLSERTKRCENRRGAPRICIRVWRLEYCEEY